MPRRTWLPLLGILALYLGLALSTVREVGLVGEVAIGQALSRPPRVLVDLPTGAWADGAATPTVGARMGPLVASQVRPIERMVLGPTSLPLAINAYTGGPPDWPDRVVWALTGRTGALTALHVLLGGLLLVLVHRFLFLHASRVAATTATVLLATDWCFVFYRKVLGGTELLLLAAGLLCLWAIWSRRWKAGRHGLLALGIGIGAGLLAKITFVLTLAALLLAALLTRWDRPNLRPPLPDKLIRPFLAMLLLLSPLLLTWAHHLWAVPVEPHVLSHDFPGLQLRRVGAALAGERGPAREGLANLGYWAMNPLAFLGVAYQVPAPQGWAPWRLVGFVVLALGVIHAWRDRHPTPREALLRFTSLYLVFQVGLLWGVARDLHHLAQASLTLCIVAGLAIDQLAGALSSRRSAVHIRNAALLALPWLVGGLGLLARTDAVVRQISVPTFTRQGQADLKAMIQGAGVRHLAACDYEAYGLLEILLPEIETTHLWAAASRGRAGLLEGWLRAAEGGHLLTLQSSAPMIYDARPEEAELQRVAAGLGLEVSRVGGLPEDRAVLYAVRSASGDD